MQQNRFLSVPLVICKAVVVETFFFIFSISKNNVLTARDVRCARKKDTLRAIQHVQNLRQMLCPFPGKKIIYQISSHATLPSLVTTIYQPNTLTNMWKQWEVVMYREHPPSNRPWSQKYWQLSHQTTSIRYRADLLGDIDHRGLHSRFCRYTESRKIFGFCRFHLRQLLGSGIRRHRNKPYKY